jgi:carbon-monoxide dehydrogenase medium subunit
MYPANFEYHRASSVDEALSLLAQNEDSKLLAGGHSLLPMMKLRLAQPAHLIDIGGLSELGGIERQGDSIRIGALTTHAEIAASSLLADACPLLAEAAAEIGDPQVRNRGTIGGNLTHADPASDLPAVVRVLGATLHVTGPDGTRSIAASDFFVDLLTSALGEHEILTAVEVPVQAAGTGSAYLKFEHPASGYAVVGAAAVVSLAGDGSCTGAALCLNGVTATPLAASAVGEALAGSAPSDEAIAAAVNASVASDDPLGDVFASGEYRLHVARVYAQRALAAARDRAS